MNVNCQALQHKFYRKAGRNEDVVECTAKNGTVETVTAAGQFYDNEDCSGIGRNNHVDT